MQELQEVWELYPDFRFGQLVVNVAGAGVATMYHLEEDSWLHLIRSYKKELLAKTATEGGSHADQRP